MENVEAIIKKLCGEKGISGNEKNVAKTVSGMLSEFSKTQIDKNNTVCATMGEINSDYHIMLDAHIDQIGFVVTDINEFGIISFTSVGGFDKRILNGARVVILGKEEVKGKIVSKKTDAVATAFEELFIDTLLSKSELSSVVALGDSIIFDSCSELLLNNNFAGRALDNRCGVATLIRCGQMLKDEKLNCRLSIVCSSQEETSGFGAKAKAFSLSPDEAVVVDVSFAKQYGVDKAQFADLAGGAMIGISPILDNENTEKLKQIAKEKNIPFQLEVMGGYTGTNSDKIAETGAGVRTTLLSIPLRYMHTGAELINLQDIENTALLIKEYVLSKGGKRNV